MVRDGNFIFDRRCLLQLDGELYDSDQFRIDFSVKKTLGGKPNKARIVIYGLDLDDIAFRVSNRRETFVSLSAGYGVAPPLIFIGNPTKNGVSVVHKQGEVLLTIEAQDGLYRYQKSTISTSINGVVTAEDALGKIVESMDLTIGIMDVPNHTWQNGLTMHGSPIDFLDELADSVDAEWSIQNGSLQFLQRKSTRTSQAYVFSTRSGNIISEPRMQDKGSVIKSFLSPQLLPGDLYFIDQDGGFLNGNFKASNVEHAGSTWKQEWYTTATGTRVVNISEPRPRPTGALAAGIISRPGGGGIIGGSGGVP